MFCLNLMMRNSWKDLVCCYQFCREFCKHAWFAQYVSNNVNTHNPKLGINIFILTLLSVQDVFVYFLHSWVESSQSFFCFIHTTFNSKRILALFQIQICFLFFPTKPGAQSTLSALHINGSCSHWSSNNSLLYKMLRSSHSEVAGFKLAADSVSDLDAAGEWNKKIITLITKLPREWV